MRKSQTILLAAAMLLSLGSAVRGDLTGLDIGGSLPQGNTDQWGDIYVVKGGGADIWGNSDQFHFAQEEIIADNFVLEVQVEFWTGVAAEDQAWQKFGLMVRDSLDADSKHAFSQLSSGNGTTLAGRYVDGGGSSREANVTAATPHWLRLERVGDLFIGSQSADGINWEEMGQRDYSADPMTGSVFVGLAVTAHDQDGLTPTTASFMGYNLDGVSITRIRTLAWDSFVGNGTWETGASWVDQSDPMAEVSPDAFARVTIGSETVTVGENGSALSLAISEGGVVIAPQRTLNVTEGLVAPTGSVTLGSGAMLTTGTGGSLGSLTADGPATLLIGGNMSIGNLSAGPGTFVKGGAGTVTLDNSKGNTVTADPATTFAITEGTLASRGLNPLGQAGQLTLSGGTVALGDSAVAIGTAPDPNLLALHYKFDEESGIFATDSSGSARNGDLAGYFGDDSQWVEGIDGNALAFDGTTNSVSIVDYKGPVGTTARTVALWINTTDTQAPMAAWGTNLTGEKWVFRVQQDNGVTGAIRAEVSGGYHVGDTDIRGDWHHVAVVLEEGGDNVVQTMLYVDGQLEGTSASQSQLMSTIEGLDVQLGTDLKTNPTFFDGLMDDVRIYERALSAEEIGAMSVSSSPDMTQTDVLVTADSVLRSDSSLPLAFGALTFEGGTLTTSGSSPISFDGTTITGSPSVVGFDPRTPTDYGTIDVGGLDVTLLKTGSNSMTLDTMPLDAGAANWKVEGGVLELSGTTPLAGRPVVVTGNAEKGLTGILYADSVAGSDVTVSSSTYTDANDNTTTTRGRLLVHSLEGSNLTLAGGTVTFRDKTGTPGAAPDGAVASWAFDEMTGLTADNPLSLDDTNDGTLLGFDNDDSQWVPGKVGGAIHFDGVDDSVNAGVVADLGLPGPHSIALWVKADSLEQVHVNVAPIATRGATSGGFQIDVDDVTAGNYRVHGDNDVAMGPVDLDWVHLAVTVDEDNMASLYYNGSFVTSEPASKMDIQDYLFGRNRADSYNFAGSIDDVYVYDRALSAGEVEIMAGPMTVADMSTVSPLVTADSTLNSGSSAVANFGVLRLESGILTTSGVSPINFSRTEIQDTGAHSEVGINPQVLTDFGTIDANSADVTFVKSGNGDVILHNAVTKFEGFENADFRLDGGLVQLQGTDTLNSRPVTVAGGTLELTSLAPLGDSTLTLAGGTLHMPIGDTGPDVPADAIAHYSFDHPYDIGLDISGNGNDGAEVGGPTYVADGMVAGAISFDGINDGLNLTNGRFIKDPVSGLIGRTVSMWVYQSDVTGEQMIYDEGGDTNGLGIGTRHIASMDVTEVRAMMAPQLNPPTDIEAAAVSPFADGWHHLAVVYGDSSLKIYIDGAEVASNDEALAEIPKHDNGPGIGYRNSTSPLTTAGFFNGMVDEVYLYDAALTVADIEQLVAAGSYVPTPIDMSALDLTVTADSTLDVGTMSSASLGTLTLTEGILTTTGAPEGFTFAGTTINAAADAVVGIRALVDTDLGPITADGVTPVTLAKQGRADVILSGQPGNYDALTFEARGNQFVALQTPGSFNPLGTAAVSINGGNMMLSSTGGDVTYDNPIHVVADGKLTAGTGEVGSLEPAVITAAGPISVDIGTTLSLQSNDDYTLNVTGNLTGEGTANIVKGNVNLATADIATLNVSGGILQAAAADVQTLNLSGGTLQATGDLGVGTFTQTGGVIDLQENALVVGDHLMVGETSLAIGTGNSFRVTGTDLSSSQNVTLTGGILTVEAPLPGINDGLVVHWALDDGAGNVAVNSVSPGDKDGSVSNFVGDGTEWVEGRVGGALDFDGDDDRVIASLSGQTYVGVTGSNPRSMAAWIKSDGKLNAGIMDWGKNSGGQKWTFRTQDGSGPINGNIRVEVNGGYIVGTTVVTDNEWHHVAAVLPSGESNVNKVLLYVDGVLEEVSAVKGKAINTANTQNARIGESHTGSQNWDGLIDDARIYDRALSEEELNLLIDYADGLPGQVDLPDTNFGATVDSTLVLTHPDVARLGVLSAAEGATLMIDGPRQIDVQGITGTGGTIAAGNINVLGTLMGDDTPAAIHVEGTVTMATGSIYSVTLAGSGVDKLTAKENVELDNVDGTVTNSIELKFSGADPFLAGDYVLISSTGEEGLLGTFDTVVQSLNKYVSADAGLERDENGLSQEKYSLTLTLDYNLHAGDATMDTVTDVRDFNVWNTNKFTSGTDWQSGDFDGNGVTDVRDFNVWNTSKFTSAGAAAPAAGGQVPEPGTLALLACGLIVLLAACRRRRAA